MILPGQALSLCDARDDGYPSVHRCDDPVTCAILSLAEEAPDVEDLVGVIDELQGTVANVRRLANDKRFKGSELAKMILAEIGTED